MSEKSPNLNLNLYTEADAGEKFKNWIEDVSGSSPESNMMRIDTAFGSTQEALEAKADLVGGLIPASQLPSFVDDVLEFPSLSEFPTEGEPGKIYVDTFANLAYRWSGSSYVEISPSVALGETAATAYRGDRGKSAYDHSQLSGNPHNSTAAQVGADPLGSAAAVQTSLNTHTGSSAIHITSSERSTWNAKLDASQKGAANGVASLGSDGKVPASQLQASADTLNFGKTNGENGLWDRLDTPPVGTLPIRYNGYLRATRVYGVYYSDSADFAEAYKVSEAIEAGEIAVLCEDGVIRRSTIPGDARALGIVSTAPAHVIGGEGIPIALSGRVPAKVIGKVKAGDYLTSSDVPGFACVADRQTAPRGSIIAMALGEKNDDAQGQILAFVMRL